MAEVVEDFKTDCFEIRGAVALDPIQVILQDLGMKRGRITVTCYGCAWTAYFNAMMAETIAEFVGMMGPEYLTDKLEPPFGQTKSRKKYLERISETVCKSVRARVEAKTAST